MATKIEKIISQYPKTDDCELQTLGELREWQIEQINKLVCSFADWYCNAFSNAERGTPEEMLKVFDIF